MIRIYPASGTHHAAMWREARHKWPGVIVGARWVDYVLDGVEETETNARSFWRDDHADVKAADALIVFAAPGDRLRGALVEAGMAIALGKPVYVVGVSDDFGTWQFHPSVVRVPDIASAVRDMQNAFVEMGVP